MITLIASPVSVADREPNLLAPLPSCTRSLLVMHIWSLLWHQIAQCFVLLAWSGAWRGVRASATNATIDDADPRIQYSDGWNVGGHCDM